MIGRLSGKVAIVTGSGQGIGRATAIAMAKEGAGVVTNSRKPGTSGGDAETTTREIEEMGGQSVPFFGDISDFDVARKLVETAVDRFDGADILINNAGIGSANMIWDMTEQEWDSVIDICLKGSFNCIRHAAGWMIRQKWGRIINTTSFAWLGTAGRASYNAAKAGVVGLTRGVAKEVGGYRVTCNAYAPWATTRLSKSPEAIAVYKKRVEIGDWTRELYDAVMNMPAPETIPPLLVYLSTKEAADINGQIFNVYGNTISIYSEPEKKKSIVKDEGLWTVDELISQVPKTLLKGYRNPASAQPAE
jgi:3-oxoacyl-[acyl-carrier protein] reductase